MVRVPGDVVVEEDVADLKVNALAGGLSSDQDLDLALCPERGAGAALVLPACNCDAMQLHLDEIATKVGPGAHAILLLDQAGSHGAKALVVPSNVSLLPLPPRATTWIRLPKLLGSLA